MQPEVVVFEAKEQVDSVKLREGSLTRRAALTFVSSMLRQGAGFVVSFVVTPIVIGGLGAELYGAWMMIQQTVGYVALSDLRPVGTLKFTLAVRQHIDDVGEKRRQIGASLLVWAATFPFILVIGGGVVWAAPFIIRTSAEHLRDVRVAMALAILSVALGRILSLPANVLRGMNLDYKAMGLDAATILVGGALSAVAIWTGWGLPGVAAASIAGVILNGGVRFLVARRVLPWFGAERPTRQELIVFTKLSGWLFLSALSGLLLNASDFLLLGIILGPSASAVYATTGAVLRLTSRPISQLLGSGGPGIAELCGRREWLRVQKVRTELHVAAVTLMTVVGVGVLILNRPFLSLWIGHGFYAGNATNLLLVLVAFETVLFRIDSVIVDSMLEFRRKALAVLISGAFSLFASGLMSYAWGIVGMALGMFLGRLGLIIYLPALITLHTGDSMTDYLRSIIRPLVTACLLFIVAYVGSSTLQPATWLSFFIYMITVFFITASLMGSIGLSGRQRQMLLKRVAGLIST